MQLTAAVRLPEAATSSLASNSWHTSHGLNMWKRYGMVQNDTAYPIISSFLQSYEAHSNPSDM